MSEEINISVNAKIRNGPNISFSVPQSVEAYSKLDFVVGGDEKIVQLVSAEVPSVQFLLIKSSRYDEKVHFKVNTGEVKYTLDTPQCYLGKGSLKALSGSNPLKTLKFNNELGDGKEATIQILVGRDLPT